MTARLACAGLLAAALTAPAFSASAGEDEEMRQRPPFERSAQGAGCIDRVRQQFAPPPERRTAPDRQDDDLRDDRRRAERLGAAIYARCGLPR